jgi:3-hydroxybutyryl-CoA dehydrogenase
VKILLNNGGSLLMWEIRKIMVVGAGQMGTGITQVFAQAGHDVILVDLNEQILEKSIANIASMLERSVKKERITAEQKAATIERITPTVRLEDGQDADFVLEAVTEDTEIKKDVFRKLDKICQPEAIFASNTSTISITLLGGVTERPDKVIGMHFFIPAPVMKLVEIIKGLNTSIETFEQTAKLAEICGKDSVEAKDYAAFTVNRLLVPMWNEAMFLVMEGNNPEEVDKAMRLGANFPMGPLELADFAGLDTVLSVIETMHKSFGEAKYRPCPLLKKMVEAGQYGRKSGQGFYKY